ncbi:MAG: oligosaccharide flippase family protein, partial [Planctomycetia bacterium]|nr:oligosaccharide flippase family protein [Planctomycetia bacterium]
MSALDPTLSPAAAPPAPAAPLSGWRRLVGDSLVVGAATAVSHVLGAVTSLLLRVFLDPEAIGIWQGLKLYLSYGNYAGLGVSKAAARELSLARGNGAQGAAQRSLNLANTVNTGTSALYAIVLLGIGVWVYWRQQTPLSSVWAMGLVAVAVLTMVQRNVTFQVSLLRADQSFRVTSQLTLLEGVLTLGVSCAAAWLWGLPGLLAGTLVILLASLAWLRPHALPLAWAWNFAEVRRLIAVGGPLLLAGIASSLFRSLDKIMVLAFLADGEHQLGVYSIALLVCAQLYGAANMLSTAALPRYTELLGRTGDPRAVARLAARTTELHAAILSLPAALAITAGWPALAWLLPKYAAGLDALLWLVPGTLAVALA